MSEKKSKFINVGEVKEGKPNEDGSKSFYIKFKENVSFKEGENISLKDPRDKYDLFVERGLMEADEAEEKKARIPDFVKFELTKKRD